MEGALDGQCSEIRLTITALPGKPMRITAKLPIGDSRSKAIVVELLFTAFSVRCVADCISCKVTLVSDGGAGGGEAEL